MHDKAERVKAALERNHINACVVSSVEQAKAQACAFLTEGCRVAVGGSVTLWQTGIMEQIENGHYFYNSRYKRGEFKLDDGLSEEQIQQSYKDAYTADVYFTSANAVTEDGKLVFVDGQGNRISAVAYGPRKVIVVIGLNKIVKDEQEAWERIRTIAAPQNNLRYQRTTPCVKTGYCVDCRHPDRGCSDYLVVAQQRDYRRIYVIIVEKTLGF